jgi:hypothetical protein
MNALFELEDKYKKVKKVFTMQRVKNDFIGILNSISNKEIYHKVAKKQTIQK